MNLTVFANSTLYTPMPDEDITLGKGSTLDYLQEKYPFLIEGNWINGLTVMNVKNILQNYLKERHRKNWVILNVGAVECYSHPAKNFIYWCCQYLNFYGLDSLFTAYVLPKMLLAAKDLNEQNNQYFQTLTAEQFGEIFASVLPMLEGFSVIVIGLSKPNVESKRIHSHWRIQAEEYKNVIECFAKQYNNITYIDCWNKYDQYVVDTTHLTPEGHFILFQEIQSVIEAERGKYEQRGRIYFNGK